MTERVWAAYRGPCHVIVDCDDGMETLLGFDPRGMPAREAFHQPIDSLGQRLMDEVYATGVAGAMESPDRDGNMGIVVIVPLRDEYGVWGLTTLWLSHRPVATPRPSAPASPTLLRESA